MLRYMWFGLVGFSAFAAAPEAKTALWLTAAGPAAHDTYAHRSITLKGSSSESGPNIQATWDFGDGSAPASLEVNRGYDVSVKHSYFGAPGQEFEARLTVRNTDTGESSSAAYLVAMREQSPEVEINIAIDEGLWRLHLAMHEGQVSESDRFAFETHGHSADGPKSDPYTDTLAALKQARENRAVRQSTLSGEEQYAIATRQNADGSWTSTGVAGESAIAVMSLAKAPVSRELGINSVLNVSGSVTATTSSIVYNRATGTYNVTLTITNTSAGSIAGPINVGITAIPGGITLANATGTFNGAPYIFVTASPIAPGGQAAVQLRFNNPAAGAISFGRVTYSGTFPPAALTIACPANTATVGTPYSSTIDANGGAQLYTFSISPGSLPTPLTLDAQTGAITGTPDTAGPYTFTAVVTDSAGAVPQTVNTPCTITVGNGTQPDLTITKTHSGSFTQGSTGNTYTVTVSNSGSGNKTAGQSVSVTDAPPSGLTVTAMSGSGWTCSVLPTCTRTDVLLAGNSYPAITVTVTVATNATSPQVNSITVTSAETESNAGNNTATDSTVIVQPDLTITKTHTGDFVQGSTANDYTVTVTNSGLGTKLAGQSVSVTDVPPTGLTVTAMSGAGWTCTTLPTCTRNDVLAAGNAYPAITVTVSVAADATSPKVNSITVTTAQNESNSGNNTATDSTVITPGGQPDLTITKTHTGNFTQGSTGNTYTVTVTNSGTGDKTAGQSVSVTDVPPTGMTVTAMSGTGWTCTTLPTCTRNDVLAPSASYPALTVTVSIAADATSPKVNTITVTTAQTESNAGNNAATDSTVIVQPDLTISKSHTGNFVQGSTGNDYTVTVTNSGQGTKLAGQSVSVTDVPPTGMTVTAMSGTGWTCTTLPTCTRNDVLAPSASYSALTVTVSIAADATSPKVNSITVTTAQNESNSGNNAATDSTVIVQPDLTISKSHSGNFVQGSTGNNYTVTVTNSGAGTKLAGQSVSVTDVPPTGMTVTAMSGTGWTCTTLPTCTRNDVLAPSASYSALTVTVSIAADATSPKVNSITVTTAQNESNSGNNAATDSTVITPAPQPDLTITKTHTGNFTQGSTGNPYTVTVTNSGTGSKTAGQSVSVTDVPPTGLSVTAMSGSGWTCTTLPTCTRNDVLAASASYPAITVTVSVAPTATSPQVNTITVTTAQTESNAANNTATDSTVIVQPDLTITKTHTGDFTQGSTGNNYTVTVTNSGLGTKNAGQSVSVTDVPPTGLSVTAMNGTGWTCTTLPTCTRNDALAAGASYSAITVTVSVAANATSPQVNSITVTTAQSESSTGNNTATDSTVIISPPAITSPNSATFAPGLAGQSFTVTTTGQPSGASMVISETGALPTGVTFTNNNNGTATISGTPAAGTQGVSGNPRSQAYPLTIGANNGVPPPASQAFTLNITCPVITVSGASTLSVVFGVAMTPSTFTRTGGSGTIAWSATGLPTNLTIGSGTGTVSGTPNGTGNFSVTITATDAGGCTGTKSVVVTVVPNVPAQAYTGVGNTQFFITGVAGAPTTPAVSSASGLLTGVTPAGGVTVTGASCTGGTIATDTAGLFIFTPNLSVASAACTYTVASNTGAGSTGAASATANLTFTLNNKVWYVSHGSVGAHDGRSNSPFLDMGGGANNLDCSAGTANGDYIYVAQGTGNTTGSCALKTNQSLIGAGTTLTVGPLTVTGNAANTPTLTGTLTAPSATGLTVNGVSLNTGSNSAVSFVSSGGNFTFRRIDTSGAATPITLTSTTGTFTVAGDGTGLANGSGGTLANSTTAALTATTAGGTVTLNSMTISITINAVRGVLFDNLAGGTLAVNVIGCTFTGVGPGNVAQNKALLQFDAGSSANVTPNVQNSYFFNNRSYGLAVVGSGSATVNVTLNQSGFGTNINTSTPVNQPGSTITNAPPFSLLISNSEGSHVHYNVTNNTFWGARVADGAIYAVTISGASVSAGGSLNGFFTGNKIGKTGSAGSGCLGNCAGLGLLPGTGGSFNATVNNNDVRQVGGFGINAANTTTGSTVSMIVHITGNTVAEPDTVSPSFANRAILVTPAPSTGATVNACAEITTNTISGSWQPTFFVRISSNGNAGTLVLPGLSPSTGASGAQIDSFVEGNNPGVPAGSVGTTVGGPINGGAACAATP